MRRSHVLRAVVLLAWLDSGCTFYTACPTGNDGPTPGGGGSGNAGSGSGGSDIVAAGNAPKGEWENETFNLAGVESECGNISLLSVKPDEDMIILTVAQHGLFSKASADTEWLPLGQGDGSAVITNRGSAIIYDPADTNRFWESGVYNEGGVYRTDDKGQTFVDLGLRHNDYVTVDFSDPDRQTLLASGHEQAHKLYRTVDGGTNWEEIGDAIPEAAQVCSHPLIIDPTTYLLGCGTYGGGEKSIWRSTDAGESWERVSDHGSGAAPLVASNGIMYWMGEPRDGIVKSEDSGETWSKAFAVDEMWGGSPIELPDGRIAALGRKHILVSADEGEHWKVVTTDLPFDPTGIAYSTERRGFYAYYFSCEDPVPDDAVMSFDFDYEND